MPRVLVASIFALGAMASFAFAESSKPIKLSDVQLDTVVAGDTEAGLQGPGTHLAVTPAGANLSQSNGAAATATVANQDNANNAIVIINPAGTNLLVTPGNAAHTTLATPP
jgi:hypothetical protein